jgi:hypothetical protein
VHRQLPVQRPSHLVRLRHAVIVQPQPGFTSSGRGCDRAQGGGVPLIGVHGDTVLRTAGSMNR